VLAAQIASTEDDAAALAGASWLMTRLSMMVQLYVPTPPLHTAIKGRETELLDAVGIAWQDGAPHIRCPYAAHSDHHPSWRWDRAKARAYCTCIERGWHSIFDVVMRVESLDFEAAKLRIAEILGLTDLIKGVEGIRIQAMDAARLLRPPADQRDDLLGHAYLAYRLGVAPDEVAMPSTSVVGWRSLPYYDPPAERGGQPKLVGRHPCVVFEPLHRTVGVTLIVSTRRPAAPRRPSLAWRLRADYATRRNRRA
jgi:hypothetical protein